MTYLDQIKKEFEDTDIDFTESRLHYAEVKLLAIIADELRILHARNTEEQKI